LLHVTLWVHTVAPRSDIMSGNRENVRPENSRAAGKVPTRPEVPSKTAGQTSLAEPRGFRVPGLFPGCVPDARVYAQTALPATHSAHDMFQPLSPLSGATVLSGEFFTITTSPRSELS
jgi:hypothetical protein